jgi:hypothetical protein
MSKQETAYWAARDRALAAGADFETAVDAGLDAADRATGDRNPRHRRLKYEAEGIDGLEADDRTFELYGHLMSDAERDSFLYGDETAAIEGDR